MAIDLLGYTALPGKARIYMGILGGARGRLFLAKDHVLHVQIGQYTETSRRFYLKDIQALTLRPSRAHIWAIAALTMVTGLLFVPAVIAGFTDDIARYWLAISGGILAIFPVALIGWNLMLGPRCHLCLHTAAHVEELYGQSRAKTAHKVSAILAAAIREAQQTGAAPGPAPASPAASGSTAYPAGPDEPLQ